MSHTKSSTDICALDELVLSQFPRPIAVHYCRLLESATWEARTHKCFEVFEIGLRAITLGVLSQYLIRDLDQVHDLELDRKLVQSLARATLGQWVEFFFLCLRAYDGHRELLFMPELYDLYWDTSKKQQRPRKGVRGAFQRLVELRNDVVHLRRLPAGEKEWEELGRQALGHLRRILEHFDFLQGYDLIRIVDQQDNEYDYEQHTGQTVTRHRGQLCRDIQSLRLEWFYLCRPDRSLLPLHPLFTFWFNELGFAGDQQHDAAVFARLLKEAVEYTAIVLRESVMKTDSDLVEQWWRLLKYLRERISETHRRAGLSWASVKQATQQVTKDRMETAQAKYRPELYLQREEVLREFQAFIASDKSCLVLTGRSGVGKSSFVLSLVDALGDMEDVCLLMYNAARLGVSESMVQVISQDLSQYLELEEELPQNLLKELDQLGEMVGKTLIVVFDAINENAEGKTLLKQIDQMVGDLRYPWLKVLITSRPEAWRIFRKGLQLAEARYYREQRSDEQREGLQEFTVKLEPFKHAELPEVYEKYRIAYGLKTRYGELKTPIQDALREPLVLRLVADIFHEAAIPQQIHVTDIYEQYVQALLTTERLYEVDLILLEQELMPLMLADGHYANYVTTSQLHTSQTRDGRPLWELILSDDSLGNGQKVNASYQRLVDMELLVKVGSDWDYTIRFEYERFYEYFAGRRLRTIRQRSPYIYKKVGSVLGDCLFLWGALVYAITLDLLEGDGEKVFDSLVPGARDNPLLRSVLITAMTRFGEKDFDAASECVKRLAGELTPLPRNIFEALWRLVPLTRDRIPEPSMEQQIAIEAAAALEMIEFLAQAAADVSPKLRGAAALHTFYLWQKQPEKGFQVLDQLSQNVSRFNIPNLGAAESILAMSGAILGQGSHDEESLGTLLAVGRKALRKLLLLGDAKLENVGPGRVALRSIKVGLFHRRVLGSLLGFVIRMITGWRGHAGANMESLGHVFTLTSEQKARLQSLIPYLDRDERNLGARYDDLITMENSGDQISAVAAEMIMLVHGTSSTEETLPLLIRWKEDALRTIPPEPWAGAIPHNAWLIAQRPGKRIRELRDIVEESVQTIQNDPDRWSLSAQQKAPVYNPKYPRTMGLAQLAGITYEFQGNVESPLLSKYLERAKAEQDEEYLTLFVTEDLTVLFELGCLRAALQALELITDYNGKKFRTAAVEFLVRARRHDPDTVEDLLLQGVFPKDLSDRVWVHSSTERLADLMTWQLAKIMTDIFLLGPSRLNLVFRWMLSQSLVVPNLSAWFALIAKEMVNLLAGEIVFSVPPGAPSRAFFS